MLLDSRETFYSHYNILDGFWEQFCEENVFVHLIKFSDQILDKIMNLNQNWHFVNEKHNMKILKLFKNL